MHSDTGALVRIARMEARIRGLHISVLVLFIALGGTVLLGSKAVGREDVDTLRVRRLIVKSGDGSKDLVYVTASERYGGALVVCDSPETKHRSFLEIASSHIQFRDTDRKLKTHLGLLDSGVGYLRLGGNSQFAPVSLEVDDEGSGYVMILDTAGKGRKYGSHQTSPTRFEWGAPPK